MTDSAAPWRAQQAPDGARADAQRDAQRSARLRWRCRRGMLELDLVLTGFVERHYETLDPAERIAFERLLETPDPTLLAYLQGSETPDPELRQIVARLRQ